MGKRECCLFLSLGDGLLLGDTSLLASELAQVVQLGTTHFTDLVYLNRIDVRGLKGENTLYAHGARHLAHGETLLLTLAGTVKRFFSPSPLILMTTPR